MATSTPYLNLVKPAYSETADIGVLNENADKIDQAVSGQAQAIAGKPDDATEMPLGPNDTTLVSQAITNLQNEIGIVCTGNSCAISASTGQYVVLKNSTISGRADGLYTAAKTIPANTALDSTYLTPVSGGGMNDLKGQVDALNSNFASLSSRSIGVPYTIPANGQWNTNLYTFINQDLPSGYEVLGIVGLTTNETNVYAVSYQYYNGNYSFQIKNTSSAEITGNATVRYLCVKRN